MHHLIVVTVDADRSPRLELNSVFRIGEAFDTCFPSVHTVRHQVDHLVRGKPDKPNQHQEADEPHTAQFQQTDEGYLPDEHHHKGHGKQQDGCRPVIEEDQKTNAPDTS